MRARRRTGARSTCRWRSRVLQGRERQFADQERSEGKHHPAPRFFPSLLSRTLFSFLHCFASMRVKAPSWLTKADAGLPQLTPVDRNRECADRTQTRAMIPGLRCATPRGVAQGAVRPEQPGDSSEVPECAEMCHLRRAREMCKTNPIQRNRSYPITVQRITRLPRAQNDSFTPNPRPCR